jgi:hypothetical protein
MPLAHFFPGLTHSLIVDGECCVAVSGQSLIATRLSCLNEVHTGQLFFIYIKSMPILFRINVMPF